VLVLGASAGLSAADVQMSIEVPGSGNTYTPLPGETFVAEIWIASDVPLTAWQVDVDDGGGSYAMGAVTADNYDDGPPWSIPPSPGDYLDFPGGPVDMVTLGALPPTGSWTGGLAVWFELTAPTDPTEVAAIIDGLNAVAGDTNFEALPVTVTPLVLLPEPATIALLMTGALLGLRRRR
jgi:hypothetical protein